MERVKEEYGLEYVIMATDQDELENLVISIQKYKSMNILKIDREKLNIVLNVDLKRFNNFKCSKIFNSANSKNHFEYYDYTYNIEVEKSKYKVLANKLTQVFNNGKTSVFFGDEKDIFSVTVQNEALDENKNKLIKLQILKTINKFTNSVVM